MGIKIYIIDQNAYKPPTWLDIITAIYIGIIA